jgi:hypothetical protein
MKLSLSMMMFLTLLGSSCGYGLAVLLHLASPVVLGYSLFILWLGVLGFACEVELWGIAFLTGSVAMLMAVGALLVSHSPTVRDTVICMSAGAVSLLLVGLVTAKCFRRPQCSQLRTGQGRIADV